MAEILAAIQHPLSLCGFVLILVFRLLKKPLADRYPSVYPVFMVMAVLTLVAGLGLAYLEVTREPAKAPDSRKGGNTGNRAAIRGANHQGRSESRHREYQGRCQHHLWDTEEGRRTRGQRMKAVIVLLLLALCSFGQTPPAADVRQESRGPCSPTIANVDGNVTIHYDAGACSGADLKLIEELKKILSPFLADYPKTVKRLQELLDKKDVELAGKGKEVQDWVGKYEDLSRRLEEQAGDDELSRKAFELLQEGDLERAGTLLDEILARDEMHVDRAARNHFNRALAFQLEFQPLEALPHLEKAYQYRPAVRDYAHGYATLLHEQNQYRDAEPVYRDELSRLRELAKTNPDAYRPDVAMTLNDLAVLYRATQRLEQAEGAYAEALAIRRELAKANPDAYLPDVAMTLNNLADVYRATQRIGQAEGAVNEALATYRELAKTNPDAYLPYVALTLNNLANLYSATQRLEQAEGAYDEALATYRELAKTNPDAYLPYVALTLNNLANLYSATQRLEQAEGAYDEALATYRELAKTNPDAYRPDVALTLNNLAILYSATQRLEQAEGAYDEALATYRELVKTNPDAYRPYVAHTLNNLVILYRDTQRLEQAEGAVDEALAIRRELAKTNPAAYLPYVAMTLNNLANLYRDTQRLEQAEGAVNEALRIQRDLHSKNAAAFGNGLARSLFLKSLLKGQDDSATVCGLAREAQGAAWSEQLKTVAKGLIEQHCAQ